jgi:hypothetical protein
VKVKSVVAHSPSNGTFVGRRGLLVGLQKYSLQAISQPTSARNAAKDLLYEPDIQCRDP